MTEPIQKECYSCRHFNLCRIRDKASNLLNYANSTGDYLTDSFRQKLYALMGSLCSEYAESGIHPEHKEETWLNQLKLS